MKKRERLDGYLSKSELAIRRARDALKQVPPDLTFIENNLSEAQDEIEEACVYVEGWAEARESSGHLQPKQAASGGSTADNEFLPIEDDENSL